MDCRKVQVRLSEYRDDVLPAEEQAAVRAHLEACTACARELAALESLAAELGGLPKVTPRPDFLAQVQARVAPRSGRERLAGLLFRPLRLKLPLELAAVAAMVLVVFVVWQAQGPVYAPQTPPLTAPGEEAEQGAPDRAGQREKAAGGVENERSPARGEGSGRSEAVLALREPGTEAPGAKTLSRAQGPAAVELVLVWGAGVQLPPRESDSAGGLAPENEMAPPSASSVGGDAARSRAGRKGADEETAPSRAVEQLIAAHGGRALDVGVMSPSRVIITAEIPAGQYAAFCEALQARGALAQSPLAPAAGQPLAVRITLDLP